MKKARQNYPEHIVPMGGIVLTAGIDVQHNRFAIILRARGRNNCSWLVTWKEIFGNVLDPDDDVWKKLTDWVLGDFPHAAKHKNGASVILKLEALSIDCSDGKTSELVYNWVNALKEVEPTLAVFAAKGSSDLNFNAEIFTEPGSVEANSDKQLRSTMASSMGVTVFIMGAHKAHEEILRRVSLVGVRDRYYHNETSYGQYEEQMLSCIKRISSDNKVTRYELKPGKRKEAIDCEKLALHAAHGIQLQNWTAEHWAQAERSILDNK